MTNQVRSPAAGRRTPVRGRLSRGRGAARAGDRRGARARRWRAPTNGITLPPGAEAALARARRAAAPRAAPAPSRRSPAPGAGGRRGSEHERTEVLPLRDRRHDSCGTRRRPARDRIDRSPTPGSPRRSASVWSCSRPLLAQGALRAAARLVRSPHYRRQHGELRRPRRRPPMVGRAPRRRRRRSEGCTACRRSRSSRAATPRARRESAWRFSGSAGRTSSPCARRRDRPARPRCVSIRAPSARREHPRS